MSKETISISGLLSLRIRLRYILIITIFIIHSGIYSQSVFWALDSQIIDFTTGEPVLIQGSNPELSSGECKIGLSDEDGNVIFYVDSYRTFDKNFNVMSGSQEYEGHWTVKQGVGVAKQDDNSFFVFRIGLGSFLSIFRIDMNQNSGLGEVVSGETISGPFADKLILVNHPEGGLWIVTHLHSSSIYRVFRFLDGQIVSHVDTNTGSLYSSDRVGMFSYSPQRNLLVAHTDAENLLELLHFDPVSGHIEHIVTYHDRITNNTELYGNHFNNGAFSDCGHLYYTSTRGFIIFDYVVQLDLRDLSDIKSDTIATLISQQDTPLAQTFVNRASDGRMYVNQRYGDAIHRINQPSIIGEACDWQDSVILLPDHWPHENRFLQTGTYLECINSYTYYLDEDQDGFGTPECSLVDCSDIIPDGYSNNNIDCDDTDAGINPGMDELASNGIDENCDGEDLILAVNSLDEESITIYPNPVEDILTVESTIEGDFQLQFFNSQGELVTKKDGSTIDCSEFPEGMYVLKIIDEQSGDYIVERVAVVR